MCRLGIATNRETKNKNGETFKEVCFVDVTVWGKRSEWCHQNLSKGKQVFVDGYLKLDSWEDASGQKHSKHSIMANSVQVCDPRHEKITQ